MPLVKYRRLTTDTGWEGILGLLLFRGVILFFFDTPTHSLFFAWLVCYLSHLPFFHIVNGWAGEISGLDGVFFSATTVLSV